MDPADLHRRLEAASRHVDAVHVLIEARLALAVSALAAALIPRAEREVLASASALLGDPHLGPDELLIFVEPQRLALTTELADVDAAAAAAEARRLHSESAALTSADHSRLMLLSQAVRLDRLSVRRRRAEEGLRILDDDVIECARRLAEDRLTLWLRRASEVARFDAVVAALPPRSVRGVARTANVLAAGLRYIEAIVERRLTRLKLAVAAMQLHDVIADGTEPSVGATAAVPDPDDITGAIKVVIGVASAIERFRDFDAINDGDILWDILLGDDSTKGLLGDDQDGSFIPEVVAARLSRERHVEATIDLEATLAPAPGVTERVRARGGAVAPPSSTDEDVAGGGGRLGRYQLLRRLGAGGMAQVWLARQEGPRGFQKDVVVKQILDEHAADPYFISLFQKEARIIAGLQHPNIIHVFDLGVEGDRWFMAMEVLHGKTLLDLLRRHVPGTFPVEMAARIMADAARGLSYAHLRPVIHRDISPDNLFCTLIGATKIIDFGVAQSQQQTNTSAIKGKVPFMAPEVFRGEAIDGGVDVFAMGVTIWAALVGQRPFRGRTLGDVMQAITTTTAAFVQDHRPVVPDDIDALVAAMLGPRADRPDAAEVERSLMTFAASPQSVAAFLA